MPIIDGFTASKFIKTLIRNEGLIKTIIIGNSGIFLEDDIKKAYDYEMDDILMKPASSVEIKDKLVFYLK